MKGGYEVVEKMFPYVTVYWKLQYADVVDIIDKEVRGNIVKEL